MKPVRQYRVGIKTCENLNKTTAIIYSESVVIGAILQWIQSAISRFFAVFTSTTEITYNVHVEGGDVVIAQENSQVGTTKTDYSVTKKEYEEPQEESQ